MTIKTGMTHPLSVLSTSSKELSPVEQRQYLYNQERSLERSVRYQQNTSETLGQLTQQRASQIDAILNFQKSQADQAWQAANDLSYGLDTIGQGISHMGSNIRSGLDLLNENQIIGFQNIIKGLGVIDDDMNSILESIQKQTVILHDISSEIENILGTLENPRKVEGLEYKRDAIKYMQQGWFNEGLEYFNLAAGKLTTDYDVYFLMGIIEFEENNDYESAIDYFKKAVKYSQPYDNNVYVQALDKLASIYFIKGSDDDLNKAFEFQLEAVKQSSGNNISYIYNLLKYSVIVGEKGVFKKYLYIATKLDPTLFLQIAFDPFFINKEWLINALNNSVITKLFEENLGVDKQGNIYIEYEINGVTLINYIKPDGKLKYQVGKKGSVEDLGKDKEEDITLEMYNDSDESQKLNPDPKVLVPLKNNITDAYGKGGRFSSECIKKSFGIDVPNGKTKGGYTITYSVQEYLKSYYYIDQGNSQEYKFFINKETGEMKKFFHCKLYKNIAIFNYYNRVEILYDGKIQTINGESKFSTIIYTQKGIMIIFYTPNESYYIDKENGEIFRIYKGRKDDFLMQFKNGLYRYVLIEENGKYNILDLSLGEYIFENAVEIIFSSPSGFFIENGYVKYKEGDQLNVLSISTLQVIEGGINDAVTLVSDEISALTVK